MKIISLVFLLCFFSYDVSSQEIKQDVGKYNFIENKGQWNQNVLFKTDIEGGNLWLENSRIVYQFLDNGLEHHGNHIEEVSYPETIQHIVFAEFINANENSRISTYNQRAAYYNYYLGNDRQKWTNKNLAFGKVTYHDLYDGIDLEFFESEQTLKYEFIVKPNANPQNIKLLYKGQKSIKKQRNGNVIIETELGQIIEQRPYVYQIKNGKIIEVESAFRLDNNQLSFELGTYDQSLKLIIDPVLVFATYNGAHSDNFGMTATYAYDGKAYTGGTVYGNSYPTAILTYDTLTNFSGLSTGAYGITDVFITKYSEDGTNMEWTTFIGGGNDIGGTETVHSLICDKDNNIYLYGATSSLDFPTVNAFQPNHAGGTANSNFFSNGVYYTTEGTDIYVAKFSEDGLNLLGSTYVGGSANDGVNYKVSSGIYNLPSQYDSLTTNYGDQFRGEIMLDSLNQIIITSSSRSTNFPVVNAFQNTNGGQQDAVVFKLSSDFSSLIWSSYFGGSENDAGYSVKIDSSYQVVMAGGTSSNNIPGTSGGLNASYLGGKTDGFITKITENGSSIIQSTYIGTSSYDQTIFVEIDREDNIYIVGVSNGAMPVINANYSNVNSGQFIMKLNPQLTAIEYATVFGNGNGLPNISPAAFLVDVCGNVYVSGWGANILQQVPLNGMPVSPDAFQPLFGDGFNFYLFVLERDAESLLYASYLGGPDAGEHVDGGTSRFDKNGVVYQSVCGGCGGNSDFPTTPNAWSANNNSSNCNNLLFKFDFGLIPLASFTVDNLEGCSPLTINFNNESSDTVNSIWDLGTGGTIIQGGINPIVEYTIPGTYEVQLFITDTICNLTDTAKKVITVYPSLELDIPNDTIICDAQMDSFNLIANSFGTALTFVWSEDINFNIPLNDGNQDSVIRVAPIEETTYYIKISNGSSFCDIVDSVTIRFVSEFIRLNAQKNICLGDSVTLNAFVPDSIDLDFEWAPSNSIIYVSQHNVLAIGYTEQSQYFYLSTNYNGCELEDSIWVNVESVDPNSVYIEAFPTEVPEGGKVQLSAFPNSPSYVYSWIPESKVVDVNSQTTMTKRLKSSTDFSVSIQIGACTVYPEVEINTLEFICGDVYVFVPNAFSPNDDGNNDELFVRGQNITKIEFKIFNRWGELMFETTDQDEGWDGTFKGEKQDPDVFVYHLKVKCVNGDENLIKGNITLLK